MRGIERKLAIMKQIQENGQVTVAELAETYNVTTMTIRRDLSKLAEEGLIVVEYGGAVLNNGAMFEYNMSMKQEEHQEEKRRIAKHCVSYIEKGDVVFLDAGTTVCELAKLMVHMEGVTVMTHSLLVANILAASNVDVIMCPGNFRAKSMAFMGQLTDSFLSSFRIDKLFLGVEGIEPKMGVSVPDLRDGITKQNLIRRSDWIACMADSSKYEKAFYYNICELEQIDLLVTDCGLDESAVKPYADRTKVVIV